MPTTIRHTNTTIVATPVGPAFVQLIQATGDEIATELVTNAEWQTRCKLAAAAGATVE